jgi:hypothetical protein
VRRVKRPFAVRATGRTNVGQLLSIDLKQKLEEPHVS